MPDTKVAVAIVHGIGDQKRNFAQEHIDELTSKVAGALAVEQDVLKKRLFFQPIHWAPMLADRQRTLLTELGRDHTLDFRKLRKFIIHYAGDAIAYQKSEDPNKGAYFDIHAAVAGSLHELASPEKAGPGAPLIVIAHSLGSVIMSNYFYDLQKKDLIPLHEKVAEQVCDSPLEKGETLMGFFTLGSPLALWSLRDPKGFTSPIDVPAKEFQQHFPTIPRTLARWINYYDPDDVIGYPLRPLNEAYENAVYEDRPVEVGGWLTGATPLSHTGYWTDNDVTEPIAYNIANVLREYVDA